MPRRKRFFPSATFCILATATSVCFASPGVISARAQGPAAVSSERPEAQAQAASPTTPAASAAVGPDEVVLTVGDWKITAAEFENAVASLPPQFRGALSTLGKRGFAEQYANLRGMALEGEKQKFDQTEEFRQMMVFQRVLSLAQLTLNKLAASVTVISPEEIQHYYTSHQSEFEQAKLRGIYISFNAEAGPEQTSGPTVSAGGPPKPEAGEPGAAAEGLTEPQARAKAESLRDRIRAGRTWPLWLKRSLTTLRPLRTAISATSGRTSSLLR